MASQTFTFNDGIGPGFGVASSLVGSLTIDFATGQVIGGTLAQSAAVGVLPLQSYSAANFRVTPITGAGGVTTGYTLSAPSDQTITIPPFGPTLTDSQLSITLTVGGGTNIATITPISQISPVALPYSGTISPAPPVCFAAGTMIATVHGPVAVESLQVGDLVVTASGTLRPVQWLGQSVVDCASHLMPSQIWPVRIMAGAFGAGLPERDLYLSPGHPVLVGANEDGEGGHLVPIMCLINGTTVDRVPVDEITYWHLELDAHDIVLAEGLPAESYLDWGDRAFFTEAADHALANPDFVVPGLVGRCRPVALDGPVVDAERRRLDTVFAMRLAGACAWPGEAGLAL